jgi:hypothetical protein
MKDYQSEYGIYKVIIHEALQYWFAMLLCALYKSKRKLSSIDLV